MKNIKRISIEVLILLSMFMVANYCFGQVKRSEIMEAMSKKLIPFEAVPFKAVEVMDKDIRGLKKIYKDWGYSKGSYYVPALGYDPKLMKLIPFNLRRSKGITDTPLSGIETALIFASFRDAIASSNNQLEDRIRKLENTVNRIVNNCCPQVKER